MKNNYQGTPTLEVLEGADNYNSWIGENILKFTSSPLLEVGSGIGNISKHLLIHKPLFLSDKEPYFVDNLKKKFGNKKNVYVKNIDITKPPIKSYQRKFGCIVVINVLEHIKNDEKTLTYLRSMLKKDGNLILLVPAKKRAYTTLDKEIGHHRRYEKKELIEKLIKSGFIVEKIYFFNFLGIFTWILRDKITGNNLQLTKTQISIFDKIVIFLRPIEGIISIPVGISLIVSARKC